MRTIPFRQIHLDFHTSPLIPDVGSEFDPGEFVSTLKAAKVQSINIFAKCHHGYAYYPSKIVPVHPSLKRDLLGDMIQALHREGIRCPLYITVVWDEYAAAEHPEWLQMDSSGTAVGRKPYGINEEFERWKYLCVNSPYLDYVAAQADELIDLYGERLGVDGFWFDILKYSSDGCSCEYCRRGMEAAGMDPSDLETRRSYSQQVLLHAMSALFDRVQRRLPEALIFFNGRQRIETIPGRSLRRELACQTHMELESLASGEWGYNHFPLFVRYNQTLGKEIIGMNGRFHRSWADFGGYKNPAALEYECFNMLANCAKVCVGDQLHPRGRLEPSTYRLIGDVFAQIEAKEPWCEGAVPVADIGLLAVNDGEYGPAMRPRIKHLEAAMQLLLEDRRQFQVIDAEDDFNRYSLLVLPDIVSVDADLERKLRAYLSQGGKLLLSYKSGLRAVQGNPYACDPAKGFAVDLGADFEGFSEFRTSYLRFREGPCRSGLTEADYVVYDNAAQLRPAAAGASAEVLAGLVHPYFDRNWNHFMSHAQTPPDAEGPYAGILKHGSIVYFAHPIFRAYKQFGNYVMKRAVSNAIDLLLGERLVSAGLPSTAQVTVTRQSKENRTIIHILHYPRERRAAIDIIEDVIPLYGIPFDVKAPVKPKRIYTAPDQKPIDFTWEAGRARFTLGEVRGHGMIAIE
jgi:hypothetical protein